MTKPQGWDEAEATVQAIYDRYEMDMPPEAFKDMVRAILAAEKREREACAALAGEYVWDDHALAQATAIGLACHHQSLEIATAIRNRNGE
ncbi:MAG: hypothetical protein RLW68_01035 [Devosia marina]|uniref:hypothetical protein n=1 Tax=Devosia marina TaxID=2683198 RepID=UPI0032F075E1